MGTLKDRIRRLLSEIEHLKDKIFQLEQMLTFDARFKDRENLFELETRYEELKNDYYKQRHELFHNQENFRNLYTIIAFAVIVLFFIKGCG